MPTAGNNIHVAVAINVYGYVGKVDAVPTDASNEADWVTLPLRRFVPGITAGDVQVAVVVEISNTTRFEIRLCGDRDDFIVVVQCRNRLRLEQTA